MMMIADCQAILWDVGGTLVDYACSLPESVRCRLAGCGIDHARLSDEHIEQTYADFLRTEQQWRTIEQERAAERNWLETLLEDERFDRNAIDSAAAVMPRYFNLHRPVSGLIPLLDELSSRGLPMAVVSNWAPSLPEFLDHHGLKCYFDPIVYSAQDGIHKPDHRIFQRALDALGTPAGRAIFIGDDPKLDIAPARDLGMQTINFDPRRKSQSRDAEEAHKLRQLLLAMLEA
ncbi:MAG: HAD family hydrolase [Tepidisphaeraceae bacterium]|jgi:HAD superfamily hydrolase (TIGR01509 family)